MIKKTKREKKPVIGRMAESFNKTGVVSIYKITHTDSGRCYVGCTTMDVSTRWDLHVSAAEHNQGNAPLHRAMREYGADAFVWEVLDRDDDLEFALNVLEPSYIDLHRGYIEGFNCTYGGTGKRGYKCSDEHKKKMRANMIKLGIKPKSKKGYRYYNNGVKRIMIPGNKRPPEGFRPGCSLRYAQASV